MSNKPQHIVFHTAAAKGNHDINDVRAWHLARGFNDVGYHYYIRRSGEVQKGREEWIQGAHCLDSGMNHKSIGICFEGHGNYEQWTYEQVLSFLHLVDNLLFRYPIRVNDIIGHREAGSPKTCPGTLIDCERVRNLIRIYIKSH